jgi:predicted porin
MQKKILVLALAAAFAAPAFADTTVYGVADAAVASMSGSGNKSDVSVWSGGMAGSRLGVKASEDIGDGMKAGAVVEYSLDIADGTAGTALGAARQTLVSVEGGFGKVSAGYQTTTGYDFSRFDPTNGSMFTPLGNISKKTFMIGNQSTGARLYRSVNYTSPNMSGFTVAINYGGADNKTDTGVVDGADTSKSPVYMVSGNYANGPLAVAVVYANKSAAPVAPAASVKTTESAIGASYDLGMAKLFATYQTDKVDGAADADTAMSVSASAPFGASTVMLTYAKGSIKSAAATDSDVSGYSLAWLNSLSKTTTLYAAYSGMSQGNALTAYGVAGDKMSKLSAGASSSMIALGLNKKF